MARHDIAKIKSDYERDGYVSGVQLLDKKQAIHHRKKLEDAEARFDNMHYKSKIHTLLTSPSHDDQVTLWLALSPATAESGCMRMIPGSHKNGVHKHEVTHDENNVLLQGQTVRGIDESEAVMCQLNTGEASFHHGWTR